MIVMSSWDSRDSLWDLLWGWGTILFIVGIVIWVVYYVWSYVEDTEACKNLCVYQGYEDHNFDKGRYSAAKCFCLQDGEWHLRDIK